jgi:hypothetical protein
MKWNWGTGIALAYVVFVGVMVFQVFRSLTLDNSLVSEHYYADDIHYQEQFQKIENTMNLNGKVEVLPGQDQIEVRFPQNIGEASGEVFLFCPSDSKQDRHVPIALSPDNTMSIPTEGLKRGKWRVKIDWKAGDKKYFQESMLVI